MPRSIDQSNSCNSHHWWKQNSSGYKTYAFWAGLLDCRFRRFTVLTRTLGVIVKIILVVLHTHMMNTQLCMPNIDIDDKGLRGYDSKLFKKRFRLDVRKFVFSNRVINSWNSLPTQCVNCNTVDTFKKYVSTALESETDVNSWLR